MMKKIGITGGVGSGKSKVLEYLADKDQVVVYQADILAHEVQKPGNSCYENICAYFGTDICREDGTIDRKKLGATVFANQEKLLILNQFVHPAVEQKIAELMKIEEERGTKYFILEAALLHEKFYREILDEIWYIHVEEKVRRKRLHISRGYSEDRMTAMMQSQPSEEVFYQISARVIENSAGFEKTIEQLERAMKEIDVGDK